MKREINPNTPPAVGFQRAAAGTERDRDGLLREGKGERKGGI